MWVLLTILSMVSLSCSGQSAAAKEKKATTIKLNKADFLTKVVNYEKALEWKYLGDKPAVIDFYANWCGPCRLVAPILEELAEEYSGKIYIYKIDIDKEKELAALFGIKTIPALLFIPMKEEPQMALGALPKADIKQVIDNWLLN